jgi:hypothetical protein
MTTILLAAGAGFALGLAVMASIAYGVYCQDQAQIKRLEAESARLAGLVDEWQSRARMAEAVNELEAHLYDLGGGFAKIQ